MTAVAVWNHHPTSQELLDARLREGWHPTPSALRDGPRVLGYAACVVERMDRAMRDDAGPGTSAD